MGVHRTCGEPNGIELTIRVLTVFFTAPLQCVSKRKDFEQMQRRKAKRKGLADDHFLRVGRAPPTHAHVAQARAMSEEGRMAYWRKESVPRAVQLHPNGGQFGSARPPARAPHGAYA